MTFTITLTNLGRPPCPASRSATPRPTRSTWCPFVCSQGVTVGSFCEVGSIAGGASVTATLVATPIANPAQCERKFSNTAFISESSTTDPNSGNNSALYLHISGKTP